MRSAVEHPRTTLALRRRKDSSVDKTQLQCTVKRLGDGWTNHRDQVRWKDDPAKVRKAKNSVYESQAAARVNR